MKVIVWRFLACVAHLLDDAGDGGGSFSAKSEPFVSFFEVELVIFTFDHGIVGSNLLDVAAVAALAAIDGNDFIIRAVGRTFASETERNHK